jgi:hypothetical protein
VASYSVVREEVRRVGENQVHAVFGNRWQDFQAVALVNLDVMLGIVENRIQDSGFRIQHFGFWIGDFWFHGESYNLAG